VSEPTAQERAEAFMKVLMDGGALLINPDDLAEVIPGSWLAALIDHLNCSYWYPPRRVIAHPYLERGTLYAMPKKDFRMLDNPFPWRARS